MGQDLRRLVHDGYPAQNIVATDLRRELWNAGRELFKDDEQTFPVKFVAGDIFKITEGILDESSDSNLNADESSGRPSLVPYKGRISTIYTSLFFHVFNEAQQLRLARICAALLRKERGSIIFGCHMAADSDLGQEPHTLREGELYMQNTESWRAMWEGEFGQHVMDGTIDEDITRDPKVKIKCSTRMVKFEDTLDNRVKEKVLQYMSTWGPHSFMYWSVELV